MMNFVVFISEALALWKLGRIHYWKAFPFFYAKLSLATVCYLAPQPNDEAWARGWWATVTPALLALMVLAAVEAFKRLTGRLASRERTALAAVCIWAWVAAFSASAILLPQQQANEWDWFATYIWIQRALVIGIGAAMIPAAIFTWMLPSLSSPIARIHFMLLAILNVSIALAQGSFFFFKQQAEWTAIEDGHLTIYAAMLIGWAMLTPRAISLSASGVPPLAH